MKGTTEPKTTKTQETPAEIEMNESTEISEGITRSSRFKPIDFSKVSDKDLISWVTKSRTAKGAKDLASQTAGKRQFKEEKAAAEREIKRRKLTSRD